MTKMYHITSLKNTGVIRILRHHLDTMMDAVSVNEDVEIDSKPYYSERSHSWYDLINDRWWDLKNWYGLSLGCTMRSNDWRMRRIREFISDQEKGDLYLCNAMESSSGVFLVRGLIDNNLIVCSEDLSHTLAFTLTDLCNKGRVRPGIVIAVCDGKVYLALIYNILKKMLLSVEFE